MARCAVALAGLLLAVVATCSAAEASDDASLPMAVIQHLEEEVEVADMNNTLPHLVSGTARGTDQNWGVEFDASNVQAMPVESPGYFCNGYVRPRPPPSSSSTSNTICHAFPVPSLDPPKHKPPLPLV
jgi:hypothetical protein